MSAQARTFVIVGASLAGAKAAETLREEGFDGRLVLIGAEREPPYERPPLSKDYLRSESAREKVYVHPEGFYREHDIELITGTSVTVLDPDRSQVTLGDARRLGYDRLLLTAGATPRRLSIPGAELDGIYYLRALSDCDVLRERLDAKAKVAVIGAGWIGAECAASAAQLGAEVTVIAPASVPLERVLGAEVGGFYRDVHLDHGVELLLGTGVERFEGDRAVRRVRTSDGRTIDCDFAIVGIGVVPRVGLADDGGLETSTGSSWTSGWPPAFPTSMQPATSPTRGIRSTTGASVSSIGPTRSTRGRRRPGRCSGSTLSTTALRTSSRISTTSAWSTRALQPNGITSSSAAIRPTASSSPSGCANGASSRA
jgi:NADPH-dependent 2,4-dienoyl-CoA reductase/sulfur reductase-like enzyme